MTAWQSEVAQCYMLKIPLGMDFIPFIFGKTKAPPSPRDLSLSAALL